MTVTGEFLSEDGVFDELLPSAPLGDPAEWVGQDAEAKYRPLRSLQANSFPLAAFSEAFSAPEKA